MTNGDLNNIRQAPPSSDEVTALERLRSGPVSRAAKDGLAYAIVTSLVERGWIRAATRWSQGIAPATWQVWEITPEGEAALEAIQE